MTRALNFAAVILVLSASSLSVAVTARADATLSDKLPIELVRELFSDSQWKDSFNSLINPKGEGQELLKFWTNLETAQISPDEIVNNLFGAEKGSDAAYLPNLYPAKVTFLRFLSGPNAGNAALDPDRLRAITREFTNRYVTIAETAVQTAGIPELTAIAENFKSKLNNGLLEIHDLSPNERNELAKTVPTNHGVGMTAKDNATGKYYVTGVFHAENRYFGVDFARPFEETLITFAHEMVHAADAKLDEYRKTYQDTFPGVALVLTRWMNRPDAAQFIEMGIMRKVFFEGEIQKMLDQMNRQNQEERVKQLQAEVAKAEPTADEKELLRRWIRAGIGLTVENEYRAYGLSLVFYSALKDRMKLIPSSDLRQEYLDRLIAGDDVFARNLSANINPFRTFRMTVFTTELEDSASGVIKPDHSPQGELENDKAFRMKKVVDTLELLYLEESLKFIKTPGQKFSDRVQQMTLPPQEKERTLKEWTATDYFSFQALGKKVSTEGVVRLTQSISYVVDHLKELNEPLVALRAGVLDIHDLSEGELRFVGIVYEDNIYRRSVPPEMLIPSKRDQYEFPEEFKKYFDAPPVWTPETLNTAGGDSIDGRVVARNLTKLRLLYSSQWLDDYFKPLQQVLMLIKGDQNQFQDGISVNRNEISAQREAELRAELQQDMDKGQVVRDQIFKSQVLALHDELESMFHLSTDEKFDPVAKSYQSKSANILKMLDLMGFPGIITTTENMKDQLEDDVFVLKDQLKKLHDSGAAGFSCGDMELDHGSVLLNMGEYSFRATTICYEGKLFIVRQPNDYLKDMTTIIEDGVPHSRIAGRGSRAVRLFPLDFSHKRNTRRNNS